MLVRRSVHVAQRCLLSISYVTYTLFGSRSRRNSIDWVVGASNIAGMTLYIASAVPRSYSVVLRPNRFFASTYDLTFHHQFSKAKRVISGPWVLGRLASRARGFIYVGDPYLLEPDGRKAELSFLRRHRRGIVCYWTGSDIRSTGLMKENERETGHPNIASYITEIAPSLEGPQHEATKKRLAAVADQYADAMFLHPHANRNYLTTPVEPFLYLFPDDRFHDLRGKFDNMTIPVLTHAASSPTIKGTQLVRAAIAHLRLDGYLFEYNELIEQNSAEVTAALLRTHISIGHFYGFTPGLYGVESLATTCALVTSASEKLEPFLPAGSDGAWYVTPHDQVYEHLRELLDHPMRTRDLAQAGYEFARRNFSASANAPELNRVLDKVLDKIAAKQKS
jgi:Glycosyl transferases group 1